MELENVQLILANIMINKFKTNSSFENKKNKNKQITIKYIRNLNINKTKLNNK